jgi:hypothetical protein
MRHQHTSAVEHAWNRRSGAMGALDETCQILTWAQLRCSQALRPARRRRHCACFLALLDRLARVSPADGREMDRARRCVTAPRGSSCAAAGIGGQRSRPAPADDISRNETRMSPF